MIYFLPILNHIDGSVEDYKEFLEKYSSVLHRNHYHMLTAKHSLMQMYGRTEGYLIQDMTDDQVTKSTIFFNVSKACHLHLIVLFGKILRSYRNSFAAQRERNALS